MLKFHPSVITSTDRQTTRIISLDRDDLMTITGDLTKCIPLLDRGTTLEEMAEKIGSTDTKELTKFVQILTNIFFLEAHEGFVPKNETSGKFVLGDLGTVSVEVIEIQESVYAIKSIREIPTL
jgi:hypothetical protein